MIKAYFLSDLHLKSHDESNSEKLLLFLHSIETGQIQATHLFLVGDIFDLWIHRHRYFVDKFQRIVNAISTVVLKGVEVHYFEGNHDLYLSSFWQQDVGVKVHDGPEFFHLGPYRIRVEHGDFMNPNDKGYLFLRKLLRTVPVGFLAKSLPGRAVQKIGDWGSQTSGHYTRLLTQSQQQDVKDFMHSYAHKVVQDRFFDYLITGHTHVQDEYHFSHNGEEVISINLGSWLGPTPQVLMIDDHGHHFISV